jgi:hypothetical protein
MKRISSLLWLLALLPSAQAQRFVLKYETQAEMLASDRNDPNTAAIVHGTSTTNWSEWNWVPGDAAATNSTTLASTHPNNFIGRWYKKTPDLATLGSGGSGDSLWEDTTTPGVVQLVTQTNRVDVGEDDGFGGLASQGDGKAKVFGTFPLNNDHHNAVDFMALTSTDTGNAFGYLFGMTGAESFGSTNMTSGGISSAVWIYNDSGSTKKGVLYWDGGNYGGTAEGYTVAPDAGYHESAGWLGVADGDANLNVGLIGLGWPNSGGSTNIGVFGSAANFEAGVTLIGGFFEVGDGGTYPIFQDGALIAENNETGLPVFIARTNQVPVFEVNGSGSVSMTGGFSQTVYDLGSGTSIDPSLHTWFSRTLTADTTFTFANLANGQEWSIAVIQDASHTVTWPTVTWMPSVAAPTMDTGAGIVNVFTFKRIAGVTYGDVSQRTVAATASDNWVASGTTNSFLYGQAFLNSITVTNTINKVTITPPATSATLTIANGKTLTASKTLTLDGTDSTTMTFPSTSATVARTDAANTFTGHQTVEGVTSTGATGTGRFVFDNTPTLITPVLGVATGTRIGLNGIAADATRPLSIEMDALGTTPNAGIVLSNVTAAASGLQQDSPSIYLQGQGWKTAATAASQSVEYRMYTEPQQGSSAPTGIFAIESSIAGAAFGNRLSFSSAGLLTAPTVSSTGSLNAGGSTLIGATAAYIVTGRSKWSSGADGSAVFLNQAGTANSTLQYNRLCTTKTANYTIVALDSGTSFNNIGAGATNRLDLPTAAVGMHFYFYVDVAQNMQIQATGTDTIRYQAVVSAAAGDIHSSTIGSTIHIFCPKLLLWVVDSLTGTWVGPT